ncbi:MAG: type II toxin-antitoxin system RelE/ParE family toxin [Lachnospiraceae bacterium]|nr:type II toxin-antitoxin system RelE/ParE family toxin [Lachnospiraceae bacterium]
MAREPLSKELEDGIYELRTEESGDIARIPYFFDKGRIILCTNGFVMKVKNTGCRTTRAFSYEM